MIQNYNQLSQSTHSMMSQSHLFYTREEIERNALEYARERQFEREARLEAYKRSTSSVAHRKTLFSSLFKKLCDAVL